MTGPGQSPEGMFGELRDLIDAGVTCICEVAEATHIERTRLGQLLYGGARPDAYEEVLGMHLLIAMIDENEREDPLLRRLRLLTDAERPPREQTEAAMRQLFMNVDEDLASDLNPEHLQ